MAFFPPARNDRSLEFLPSSSCRVFCFLARTAQVLLAFGYTQSRVLQQVPAPEGAVGRGGLLRLGERAWDLLLLLESVVSRLETGAGRKLLRCSELDRALDKARRGGTRCWCLGTER